MRPRIELGSHAGTALGVVRSGVDLWAVSRLERPEVAARRSVSSVRRTRLGLAVAYRRRGPAPGFAWRPRGKTTSTPAIRVFVLTFSASAIHHDCRKPWFALTALEQTDLGAMKPARLLSEC